MPKPPSFPTTFDSTLQIHISKLKQWGYLLPEQIKSGILSWKCYGNPTGSISIIVNTENAAPFIKLNYKSNGKPRQYNIQLVSIPSNLGIGEIWYFLCPETNKRCRVLYSVDGWFLHRSAFTGCMYEKQTRSKLWRQFDKSFGWMFLIEEYYEKIYSKHFKKYYAGQPTKRYLKLLQLINQAEKTELKSLQSLNGL